jgi:hypothetical protein
MGSAAKSVSGVAIEQQQGGLYQVLAPTLTSALPASLTNTIASSGTATGARLLVRVFNHSSAGTITLTGLAPLTGAVAAETTTSLAVPEKPGVVVEYITSSVFASINASGVTLGSGLAGGTVVVYAIQVAKRLLPGETKIMDKVKEFSPTEQRGSFDHDFHLLSLTAEVAAEFTGPLYPDSSSLLYYIGYNNAPTVTSLPTTPTVILGSTSVVAGSSISAALQPVWPGQVLACVIGGAPATAATVAITGTNEYGQTITEVVVPSTKTAGTFYSANRFLTIAVTGIVYGAFGGTATLSINGSNGWTLSGNPGDVLASMALENYDSTGSFTVPWLLCDEWSLEGGADKEAKVTFKGPAQNVYSVGVAATTSNQVTAFASPLDRPETGWQTRYYIDAMTGTPGTTLWGDVMEYKLTVKTPQKFRYTSWGNPPYAIPNRAYRNRREIDIEMTCDETSTTYAAEYAAYDQRRERLLQFTIHGQLLATQAAVNFYAGPTFTLPLRWIDEPVRDFDVAKEAPILKLHGKAFFDPALGYSHLMTWNTRFASW